MLTDPDALDPDLQRLVDSLREILTNKSVPPSLRAAVVDEINAALAQFEKAGIP